MFLGNTQKATGAYTDQVGSSFGINQFKTDLKSALSDALDYNRYQTFFVKLEESAQVFSRSFGGVTGYADILERQVFDIMKNTQDFGVEMKDVMEIMSGFADQTGRIPTLQDEMIKNTIYLSNLTGISVKELAGYTAEFSKVGMGQQQSQIYLTKMYNTAKGFGLNATKLTKEVMTNLEKTNTYQFKNGVQGLTNMVARAQQLGIKFDEIMATAEKALDPEKAIEMASGMQMLGGNIGALGDPFKLLYMAQNDVEGLQNEFIKVAAASAEYNKETGQFKIGTQQMYRLKEMADQLGMKYEDVARSAISARKEQEVMAQTSFSAGMTEEDKRLLASMAEVKDGRFQVQLPGTKDWVDLSKVQESQLTEFKNAQTEANRTDGEKLGSIDSTMKDMMSKNEKSAEAQLSSSEKAANALQKMANSLIFSKETGYERGSKMADEYYETMRISAVETAAKRVADEGGRILTGVEEFITKANNAFNMYLIGVEFQTDLNEVITQLTNIAGQITNVFEAVKTQITTVSTASDLYVPSTMKGGNLITGSFGSFTTDPGDDILAAPNISEFINDSQGAFSILNTMKNIDSKNIGTLQDLLTKNMSSDKLSNMVNVNTTSTNEVKGDVGVNGEVKLKIEGLNGSLANILESDPNFQRMFKENVMNIVNERLSKSYSEKLGNL
jgi:hypothetical protein